MTAFLSVPSPVMSRWLMVVSEMLLVSSNLSGRAGRFGSVEASQLVLRTKTRDLFGTRDSILYGPEEIGCLS